MHKLFLITLLSTGIFTAGCASTPISTVEARQVPSDRVLTSEFFHAEAGTPRLLVKRDTGFMGAGCYKKLHVNGTPTALIDTGEKIELSLPAGDHILTVTSAGAEICTLLNNSVLELGVTLKAGDKKAVRLGFSGNDFIFTLTTW